MASHSPKSPPIVPATWENLAKVNAISNFGASVTLHIFSQSPDMVSFDEEQVSFGPDSDGHYRDPLSFSAAQALRALLETASGQKFVRVNTGQPIEMYQRADFNTQWLVHRNRVPATSG